MNTQTGYAGNHITPNSGQLIIAFYHLNITHRSSCPFRSPSSRAAFGLNTPSSLPTDSDGLITTSTDMSTTRCTTTCASMDPVRISNQPVELTCSIDSVVNTYLIEHCGLKPTDTTSKNPIGLVVSSGCNYFSSLSFPQVVDLGLRVSKLGNSSVTYEVGFFAQGSNSVAAVGGFTHVFVHPETRRPTAMADQMRAGLKELYSEMDIDAKL